MLRITWSRGLATLVVVVVAWVVVVVLNDGDDPASTPDRSAAASATGEVVDAPGCGINTRGESTRPPSRQDVQLGPLVLGGGNRWARWRRDSFGGHGYKIPALLPNGVVATLSVPETMRARVGLVYSAGAHELQRAGIAGVPASDSSVRFTACPAEEAGRTGWGGGIVLDRPRCVTLVVKVDGRAPVHGRVPLGRPCHGPAPTAGDEPL
jgi:hypothetical protein